MAAHCTKSNNCCRLGPNATPVTAQPSPIDPAQTSLRTTVDKELIEELPVESRDYLNFALLAPGVASSAQQPGKRSLAPLADSGFTFGGLGRTEAHACDVGPARY